MTTRPEQPIDEARAAAVADNLTAVRERGLDRLDVNTKKQPKKVVPDLDALAREYAAAHGRLPYGRIAEIRVLLLDGLAAYAERVDPEEAGHIKQLLFDPPDATQKLSPGQRKYRVEAALGLDKPRQSRRGVANTGSADSSAFDEWRSGAFHRLATFLVAFVAEQRLVTPSLPSPASEAPDEPPPPAPTPPIPAHRTPPWRRLSMGGMRVTVAGLVAASVIVAAVLLTGHWPMTRTPPVGTSPTAAAAPAQSGKTFTEMTGEFGAPTLADPHTVSGQGPKLPAYTQVQVSCKVFAPSIASVSPDGYWYRIASQPYDNRLYAAANAFMNGDKVGQSQPPHNTDFAVPDCPS